MPQPRPITVALLLAAAQPLSAQQPVDTAAMAESAVRRTREYLRINTTNPPGNEDRAMRWFAEIFRREGIPFDTASAAPGRGNVWARLRATTPDPKPALVLLHHTDVVPADPKYWSVDPFAAEVRDGHIYGRGALDTKALGIAQLEAFLALHRSKAPRDRDVVFLATADEEAGGAYGAGWIVKHRPEAIRGAGMVLNEGGGGTLVDGEPQYAIEVTQKVPLWLALSVSGRSGHGSTPPPASAVDRLVRALYRLQTHEFAPRVVPAVREYMAAVAPDMPARWRDAFRDPDTLLRDRSLLAQLHIEQPFWAAILRNTCTATMLQGSAKVNVVPPEAGAHVDCRLLPDQDREAFLRELRTVLNDPAIRIEPVLAFEPAVSPTDNPLYRAVVEVVRRHYPSASIAPAVQSGFTDSHFFRELGIPSYGWSPFLVPEEVDATVHGNDERIPIETLRRGTVMMLELLRAVTAPGGAS